MSPIVQGTGPDGSEWRAFSCKRGSSQENLGMCDTSGCSAPGTVRCGRCRKRACDRCKRAVDEKIHLCPACWVESLRRK